MCNVQKHSKPRAYRHIADVVVKELGVGTFGRVLRCYDRNYDDHVALKVVRRVKKYTESAMIEADILEDIRRKLKQSDCQICVKMYDHFKFEGSCLSLCFQPPEKVTGEILDLLFVP